MKKAAIFFCLFLIAGVGVMAQVGINTDGTNPHSSAMLDVKSSTRGLLPPRMTHAEFLAIVSPANGLIVYCTDCGTDGNGAFYGYINGVWNKILTCFPPAMPGSGTHTASVNQIVWNWNAVEGASGYRWNTANNYSTALDLGNLLTKTETGLTCNTAYTRYVWSYNACDISAPVSLTNTTTQNPPVGITIAASANPVCSGTSVTFTATPTNGGTSPAYQWSKNGTAVSGATNATYTYPPLNNDAITCQLTSGIPCSQNNPALSNTITMAVNAVPAAPSAGTHVANQTQITWNWNPVTGATGYKWNTINDTATAINMGTLTTKTETSLSCSTAYTRYVWAYNICGTSTAITLTQTTSDCSGTFICGQSLTINHVAGAVAPVNKPTEYGTVTNVPGEPAKCWITSNLGSDHQATAVDDATEASAGWYWQFNRKQGYKHDGSNTTPSWPTSSIFENSDWIIENDPCHIELGTGWRIPTNIEWFNVDNVGGWNTGIDPWNSLLKLHYAGTIIGSSASLVYRGGLGYFWSNKQENNESGIIQSADSFHSYPNLDYKHYGESLRCVYENCVSPSSPTQGTHISTPTQIIWNWNTVTEATGYKWNTTNNYATATDMGTATTKTETGLTCNTTYTRYAWAYNACGSSTAVALNQTTLPSQLPNITISASSDSVCAGNQVTLTAITENPGINPTYQWFVNGVQINSGAGVSSSGLVAYYSFNGNADDLSGNGNNGIINGATSTTDRFGAQTSAFQFNGVNSYIEVPNAPSLIFGSNDFSLNAWIYPTAFNGNGGFNAILTKHNNDNNSWLFRITNNGATGSIPKLNFETDFPNKRYYANSEVTLNTWHFVSIVKSGNNFTFYLDGTPDGTFNDDQNLTTNYPMVFSGQGNVTNERFTGKMDDIRIYNRALSNSEIYSLFNNTSDTFLTYVPSNGDQVFCVVNSDLGCSVPGTDTSNTITISTLSVPAQPGVISGPTSVVQGLTYTYSIAAIPEATSYTWTIPSSWSGTSTTNSINTYAGPNGGIITVTANNSCGVSPVQSINVTTTNNFLVETNPVSNITSISAIGGGNILSAGGTIILTRGICWDTSQSPTLADNHTNDNSGVGSFSSTLIGLSPNTTYYVRAYATGNLDTVYGNEVNFTTALASGFSCGNIISINHVAGTVAPVNKTTTYGTVTNIPGEPAKCWITSNLGSDHQATAVDDATEASAGWYWQFNRKQGYKNDGSTVTPSWLITSISENSDWLTNNDPCNIEIGSSWRIPTYTEWYNVDNIGGWVNWNDLWGSGLKLHASGLLNINSGSLGNRGSWGTYWSSTQENSTRSWDLFFYNNSSILANDPKTYGFSLRCIGVICITPPSPTLGSNIPSQAEIIWNWNPVSSATGYKFNTTNDFSTAIDMGTATTKTETGLTPNTAYTRYVWAYNSCGMSPVVTLTTQTTGFTIGQSYGGGIIFYIDGTGIHGLISATTNQSTGAEWGCSGTTISGISLTIGTGQANTTAIVNGCGTAGIAARICNDLSLNGYDDWFLPSMDELNQMFVKQTVIGGFLNNVYWSSSQNYAHEAIAIDFTSGMIWHTNKGGSYYVRAVRAF